PLGRAIDARYGWIDEATAVIEMSVASGLWRLARNERDPMRANTFGTGELISDAIERDARKIFVGLGGSATNDGGIGLAAALGYEFVTSDGEPLDPIPANLLALTHIHPAERDWPKIIAACDVRNPLLGGRGASRMFAPQKGADEKTVQTLEWSLEQLADVVAEDLGCDFRDVPGAGAAGGLGFGLLSFCAAKMRAGFDVVAEVLHLENAITACDLVVTGEGKLDAQTLEGKAPAGVASLARKHGKPVLAFAGEIDEAAQVGGLFDATLAIREHDMPLDEAMQNASALLEKCAARAAESIRTGKLLSRFFHLSG